MRCIRATICVLVGLLFAIFAEPAWAQTQYLRFAIPARLLSDALIDFAVQAHVSISTSGVNFGRTSSQALFGTFQREDALKRLLRGTRFTFDYVDADTFRVRAYATNELGPSVARTPNIETVLVTATKREETVQTLPYAISAVSGRQLIEAGIESAHGLTLEAAGLTVTNLGSGEDKLFVRGLTDSIVPGLSESVVGVYLDDARIVDDAPDPDLALIDIDRVEVLRGPEGSLYGAGSLTGLVRIVTNKPDFNDFASMLRWSLSSTDDGGLSTNFDGMLNLPLSTERLALRVAGYDHDEAGYISEVRLGRTGTNRTLKRGGRAELAWHANARLTLIANLALQGIRADDSQYYLGNLGRNRRDNLLLEPHSDNFVQAGLTTNAAFYGANLVSNTSFVGRHLGSTFDASYAWPQLTGFPLGPSPFDYAREIQSFTHETRLSSDDGGRWSWLGGLFLAHRDEDFNSLLSGPDAMGAIVAARVERREDRESEAALFGEVAYQFAPSWSVTGGMRVFDAIRKVSDDVTGFVSGPTGLFSGTSPQAGVAPKGVIEYRPSEQMMFYAQAAEGYRLGDLSIGNPGLAGLGAKFESDELWNYELGAKFDMLEHRLSVNAATYYVVWDNAQADQIAPNGAFYVLNAGNVRDLGFETEFAYRPLDGLTLQGNFFWNNSILARQGPPIAVGEGVLPGAPDVTASVLARYDFHIGRVSDGFVGINYSYVGVSYLGFGEATPSMGGYRVLNARTGLANGRWELALFADNLTDDRGNTFAFGNPFDLARSPQVTPPRPRTFGLSLTWSH